MWYEVASELLMYVWNKIWESLQITAPNEVQVVITWRMSAPGEQRSVLSQGCLHATM